MKDGSVVTCHVISFARSLCDTDRKIFIDEKMADASNGSATLESELDETRKRLEVLDKNYRNLKGLSQKGSDLLLGEQFVRQSACRKVCSTVKSSSGRSNQILFCFSCR